MTFFSASTLDNGFPFNVPSVDGDCGNVIATDGAGNLSLVNQFPTLKGTNKIGVTGVKGQVCATHSSGVGFWLANATDSNKIAIGLLTADVLNLGAGVIQTSGPFKLSDWTSITGTIQLSAKAIYYLNTVDGKLTNTPPAARGNIVQVMGQAIAPDTLLLNIPSVLML